MSVTGRVTVSVRNNDMQSVSACGTFDGRCTGISCHDSASVNASAGNIDAAVESSPTRTVGRGNAVHTGHRPHESAGTYSAGLLCTHLIYSFYRLLCDGGGNHFACHLHTIDLGDLSDYFAFTGNALRNAFRIGCVLLIVLDGFLGKIDPMYLVRRHWRILHMNTINNLKEY